MNHRLTRPGVVLIVLAQTTGAVQPPERPLDLPPGGAAPGRSATPSACGPTPESSRRNSGPADHWLVCPSGPDQPQPREPAPRSWPTRASPRQGPNAAKPQPRRMSKNSILLETVARLPGPIRDLAREIPGEHGSGPRAMTFGLPPVRLVAHFRASAMGIKPKSPG